MASNQAVWGIDMGKCALKAVRLRAAADGKVEILETEHIAHAKILTQPDANREEMIGSALEKFLSHHDISSDKVVVGEVFPVGPGDLAMWASHYNSLKLSTENPDFRLPMPIAGCE